MSWASTREWGEDSPWMQFFYKRPRVGRLNPADLSTVNIPVSGNAS